MYVCHCVHVWHVIWWAIRCAAVPRSILSLHAFRCECADRANQSAANEKHGSGTVRTRPHQQPGKSSPLSGWYLFPVFQIGPSGGGLKGGIARSIFKICSRFPFFVLFPVEVYAVKENRFGMLLIRITVVVYGYRLATLPCTIGETGKKNIYI